MNGINIQIEVQKGTYIGTACTSVKELSELIKKDLEFEFNDVPITTKNQSIQQMLDSYSRQRK